MSAKETLLPVSCRVVLIDDHPLYLRGLAQLIAQETDCTVCGEASDFATALVLLAEQSPELVILDISLRGGNGIDLLKRMRAQHPDLRVLVVSMHAEDIYAERALRAGALGYVMKDASSDEVLQAIRKVMGGEIYLSADMNDRALSKSGAPPLKRSPIESLTDRELEVLEMVGRGNPMRAIAEKLRLSVKTVESHRANLKQKLRLESSADLIRFSMKWLEDQ